MIRVAVGEGWCCQGMDDDCMGGSALVSAHISCLEGGQSTTHGNGLVCASKCFRGQVGRQCGSGTHYDAALCE